MWQWPNGKACTTVPRSDKRLNWCFRSTDAVLQHLNIHTSNHRIGWSRCKTCVDIGYFGLPGVQYWCVICSSHLKWKQEALLSQRGRAMLRVCIASIQNVERSLLLLVVSASDIPLRTIKFFLFSFLRRIRPCCRPSQTNIRWGVADRAMYTAWSSVTVFVTS